MLALKFDGDLIEGLIVLAVIVGSALSGLAKSIIARINERKRAQAEAEKDLLAPTAPPPPVAQPMSRPVARPMPPRRPVRTTIERPAPTLVELDVPDVVRPLVEMLLGNATDETDETSFRRPTPAPPPARPARPGRRAPSGPAPRVEVGHSDLGDTQRMEQIRRREEAQAQRSEKRIGHVETHVAPAITAVEPVVRSRPAIPTDRNSLRRAIVLNEILGPPVALRTADLF